MTDLYIAGGVYHEKCEWPEWNHLFGSGGRAAAATSANSTKIELKTYLRDDVAEDFLPASINYGFKMDIVKTENIITFDYYHPLSEPCLYPKFHNVKRNDPFSINGHSVLRFGMLEGSAIVDAKRCVYDPQCPVEPERFETNGSKSSELAVVANITEIRSLGGDTDFRVAAKNLLDDGAKVVIVKCGIDGAYVFSEENENHIPPFFADRIWTIGSGDVFTAIFAFAWATKEYDPVVAAVIASKSVAEYAGSMSLPVATLDNIRTKELCPVVKKSRKIYIAAPFFNISQRWLVNEIKQLLENMGIKTFSPYHDVGFGTSAQVAQADIKGIDDSDAVLAVVDGLDSGTLFEIGLARSKNKPVYVLAQSTQNTDLIMLEGSGCVILDDFCTAVHRAAWQS